MDGSLGDLPDAPPQPPSNHDLRPFLELAASYMRGPRGARDVVDGIVPLLSDWDVIYLRRSIARLRVGASSFAGFDNLPFDIIFVLLPNITIQELLAMRRVNKRWNEILTSAEMLTHLAHVYFPGLISLDGPPPEDLKRIFFEACRLHSRKIPETSGKMFIPWDLNGIGRVTGISFPLKDPAQDPPWGKYLNEPFYDAYFADGKVAMFADKTLIIVDDLNTGQRTRFRTNDDPRRDEGKFQMEAFTGKMIVMSSIGLDEFTPAAERKLRVFHLERRAWINLSLPSPLENCYANDETVIMTVKGGDVLSWSCNGNNLEIPTNHPEFNAAPKGSRDHYGTVAGVLFHPSNSNIIYLVWIYVFRGMGHNDLYSVVIVRYDCDVRAQRWTPTKRFEERISHPMPNPLPSNRCFGGLAENVRVCFSRRCKKMNSNGLHLIGLYFLVNYAADSSALCQCVLKPWDKESLRSICFNIFTESFYTYNYPGFKIPWAVNTRSILKKSRLLDGGTIDHLQVWNGELFNLYINLVEMGAQPVIQSLRAVDKSAKPLPTLPGDEPDVYFKDFNSDAAVCDGPFQVFVDDEFLILCNHHGYVIWRWDKRQQDTGDEWLLSNDNVPPNMEEAELGFPQESIHSGFQPPRVVVDHESIDKITRLEHDDAEIINPGHA